MSTGNAVDFGDLLAVDEYCWMFKWSRRFRIMSDLKINNITDRTGDSQPVIAGVSTVSSTGAFTVPVAAQQKCVVEEEEELFLVEYMQWW